MFTVEDYLEILAGISNKDTTSKFELHKPDYNLITSLARQTFRQTPFTDRQYELAKKKLLDYKDQFENNGYKNVENDLSSLRMPLREIDRSRWIKFVDIDTENYIGVRFTFNKKLIDSLEKLSRYEEKQKYDKVEKVHYYECSERSLFEVITVLKDKNFEIQQEVLEAYNQIEYINSNWQDYLPGIYKLKLKNLHQTAIDYVISDIGEPSKDNLYRYADKKQMLGLHHFDEDDLEYSLNNLTALSKKIVQRTKTNVQISPTEYNTDRLAESLLELHRFPILIILNDNDSDLDRIIEFNKSFKNIFMPEDISVMYRKDNTSKENTDFNTYVKENKINNPLANNTKIVYASGSKVNKILLSSDWTPQTTITFDTSPVFGNKWQVYLNQFDLNISYTDEVSPFRSYYSKTASKGIEKI